MGAWGEDLGSFQLRMAPDPPTQELKPGEDRERSGPRQLQPETQAETRPPRDWCHEAGEESEAPRSTLCGQSWTKNPGQGRHMGPAPAAWADPTSPLCPFQDKGRSDQNQVPIDHCTPDRVGCPLLTAQVVEAHSCFSNFI